MLPVRRSVGVKARPSKTISDALKCVLHKYNLHLDDLQVRIVSTGRRFICVWARAALCDVATMALSASQSGEDRDLKLDQLVSTVDGQRIVIDKMPEVSGKSKNLLVLNANKQ